MNEKRRGGDFVRRVLWLFLISLLILLSSCKYFPTAILPSETQSEVITQSPETAASTEFAMPSAEAPATEEFPNVPDEGYTKIY